MLLISLWKKRQSNNPDTISSMMLPSIIRFSSLILSELAGKSEAVSTAFGAAAHLAPGRGVEVDQRVTSTDAATAGRVNADVGEGAVNPALGSYSQVGLATVEIGNVSNGDVHVSLGWGVPLKMPQCRLILAKISTLQQEGAR